MEKIIIIAAGLALCVVALILAKKKIISRVVMAISMVAVLVLASIGAIFLGEKAVPSVTLVGENELTIEVFDEYKENGAKALLGEEDITDRIIKSGEVDTSKLGDYVITYCITEDEKDYSVQRKVHIVDTKSPEIKLNGEEKITVSKIDFYKEQGASATDNYDGDLTAKIESAQTQIDDENYEILYTVKDSSGNAASVKRSIIIKDIVAPTITLKGSKNITISRGGSYSEAGYSATDDLDGDLTKVIEVSGSVNTESVGTYIITYAVKDKAGNKVTAKRTVNVTDPTAKKEEEKTPPADGKSVICLTFDDGPSTTVTPRILDILKKNNVKATFFIVNYSDKTLPLIKRMIAEGHTIGIHGYSHDWSIYDSEQKFMDNINKLRDKLYKDTGYTSTVMRFPGGSSNTVSVKHCKGIMTKLVARVQKEGWKYYDWNVDSGDANGNTIPKNTLINNFKNRVKKGRTNVVLCHDIGSKTTTADALQSYIDYGKQNGFTFKAIDEDTPQCHHSVNN
ncbi:MAG: DUF5011 domain-containing protein [Clostridiales bacterium]|nr:DUF5011 domain-containing protein [Candidatus Equinaster intestinalis]